MSPELFRPWPLTACLDLPAAERASLVAQALARIDEAEPQVRAWVSVDRAAQAAEGTADAPLAGVPIAVKDIIDCAGMPTRCGSAQRAEVAPASTDAGIVALLRAAGAVPLGKSVTTEYAYFAPGPTDNPAAPGHTPGGSSSGSAAAVAAGMVPLALGSQTAGSLTRPASFCGVAGLVVTHGTLPTTGVVGLSESCDSLGLLAARVADLAVVARILGVIGDPAAAEGQSPPRVLLWLPENLPGAELEPAMVAAVHVAAARLAAAGVEVLRFDAAADALALRLIANQQIVMAYEAARERAEEFARGGLSAPLTELLAAGNAIAEADYRQALDQLAADRAGVTGWFEQCAAVLGPAALGPAPVGLGATGSPILSRGWQGIGLPALAVPGLRDATGHPLGIQLIGPCQGEQQILRLGQLLEGLIA